MSASRIVPISPSALQPNRHVPPARGCDVCRAPCKPLRPLCLRHWRAVPSEIKARYGQARRAHDEVAVRRAVAQAVARLRQMEGGRG